jgi:hypothetical protein
MTFNNLRCAAKTDCQNTREKGGSRMTSRDYCARRSAIASPAALILSIACNLS